MSGTKEVLCRCCHSRGDFRSLNTSDDGLESFCTMLINTFNITIYPPLQNKHNNFSICDDCVTQLQDAVRFRRQVLKCEVDFYKTYVEVKKDFKSEAVEPLITYEYTTNLEENVKNSPQEHRCATPLACSDHDDSKDGILNDGVTIEIPPIKPDDSTDNKDCITLEVSPIANKRKRKIPQKKKKGDSKKPKITQPKSKTGVKRIERGSYACTQCEKTFNSIKNLRIHKLIHKTPKCKYCHEIFDNFDVLKKHKATHTEKQPYKCSYCDKHFASAHSRGEHENCHTNQLKYTCDICQKDFKYKQTLKRHIRVHEGTNKTCVCEICGNTFNDRTNLNIHVQTVHNKLRPFQCNVCSKRFSANKHLVVHYRRHTGERPYKCDECGKSFTSSANIRAHMSLHGRKDRYKCRICGEILTTRSDLVRHRRTHFAYPCAVCQKFFSCKFSLNRHMRSHSMPLTKPYACDICNKRYMENSQVLRHKRMCHNPDKPLPERIKCTLCKQYFTDMEKHLKVHTNRPFACHLCNKSYPEKNTLNRHIREIHLGTPHPCDICDKKYVKLVSLKRHILKAHKVKMEDLETAVDVHLIVKGSETVNSTNELERDEHT